MVISKPNRKKLKNTVRQPLERYIRFFANRNKLICPQPLESRIEDGSQSNEDCHQLAKHWGTVRLGTF
jgi:hypothetical protein